MAEEEGAKNNKLIAIIAGVALVIVAAVVGKGFLIVYKTERVHVFQVAKRHSLFQLLGKH